MLPTEDIVKIVAGLIIWWMQVRILKTMKQKDSEHLKRGQARAEESLWVIRLMEANANLTLANCIAIRDKKCNGELMAAKKGLEDVIAGMAGFLRKQAVENYTN